MSARKPATPAPGPLEDYIQEFDDLFAKRSQREACRRYLEGLLLPMERNKTLTGLANTEPVEGAQHAAAQKLQWFLSESTWDPAEMNQRRVGLLREKAQTAPTRQGVLAIDETGDRKWGTKTAHIGRQYLGSLGKIDNGVVSVHSLWADERMYYPLEVEPYTPAHWFEKGRQDAAFRTKPAIALELVEEAVAADFPFRAVVADSGYGDNLGFVEGLERLALGYVLALKPSHSWWHKTGEVGSVEEVVQTYAWHPEEPGAWQKIIRRFRDGHEEPWWALEAAAGPYGPEKGQRLVVVSTDPATLPELTTWYLVTNLPIPGSVQAGKRSLPTADLDEVVRLYGLRIWVEQSYKQVKQSLGWAQYQVRGDLAIRRHWQLVCCAFSFCWWAADFSESLALNPTIHPESAGEGDEKKKPVREDLPVLAEGAPPDPRLVGALDHAAALLAGVVGRAPASSVTGSP
jgi:SRSO17 transposase